MRSVYNTQSGVAEVLSICLWLQSFWLSTFTRSHSSLVGVAAADLEGVSSAANYTQNSFFFTVTKNQFQVFFIIFSSTEWPEIVGRTFSTLLFSYLLHLPASRHSLCVLQRLGGRRQLASVAGPELCPSFICSAWLSRPQLCGLFVIIFIASGFAILIINLPFNPRMSSTTTICSFTKGHFPLLPTESWLLPWFDDFRYTIQVAFLQVGWSHWSSLATSSPW